MTSHLDDGDAGRGDMPGQARAVTAGALDPDQADSPEPAHPVHQPAIAGRAGRELLDAEEPADRVERSGDVHVSVSVHATGNGARLYDGQCHLCSWLKGWHAPAGR